jgi:phage shock protein PspC (stress-responsive transcriptional regulator)
MTTDSIMQEIREALAGRPGQPIVLGVCNTIATRMGWETWCVRLATIVSMLFLTLPTLAVYIIAGLVMKETEARTRGFFAGLTIIAREWMEKIGDSFGRVFCSSRSDYRGY